MKRKNNIRAIISLIMTIGGFISFIIGVIWQLILTYRINGIFISNGIMYLVKHWNLYLILGIIPFIIGTLIMPNQIYIKEKEKK